MIPEIYFIKMDVVYFSLNKNSVKPLVLTKKGSDLVSWEGSEGEGGGHSAFMKSDNNRYGEAPHAWKEIGSSSKYDDHDHDNLKKNQ